MIGFHPPGYFPDGYFPDGYFPSVGIDATVEQTLPKVTQGASATETFNASVAQRLPRVRQQVTATVVNPSVGGIEAEQGIINLLLADANVARLLARRIYFVTAPQTASPPYAVVSRSAADRAYSFTSAGHLTRARLEICVFDKTMLGASRVGDLIKEALDGFQGISSGVDLQSIVLLDENDGQEDTVEFRRLTQDYSVWFRE